MAAAPISGTAIGRSLHDRAGAPWIATASAPRRLPRLGTAAGPAPAAGKTEQERRSAGRPSLVSVAV